MELVDLQGSHALDAVDFGEMRTDEYGDSQVCRFRLDGIVYAAIEDPDDGYRSSMKELLVDDSATMKNTFPGITVVGRHLTENNYGTCDILQLIDIKTGELVLEVGTDDSEDYYPCFVANFTPGAMSINKKQ